VPPTSRPQGAGHSQDDQATTPPAEGGGLSGVRVTGQALAAVTTAAAGGFIGGAGGTVAGAAVASVVTTVGEAIYQRSLERTRDRVRKLGTARSGRRAPAEGATAVMGQDRAADRTRVAPAAPGTALLAPGDALPPEPDESPTRVITPTEVPPPARSGHGKRIAILAATGVLIFLVAMVVVTGIERVKGSPLSGGEGTSVGEVFGTRAPTTTTSGSDSGEETTTARETTSEAPTTTRTTTTGSTTTTTRSRAPGLTLNLPTP
jgi:hypothetical protein